MDQDSANAAISTLCSRVSTIEGRVTSALSYNMEIKILDERIKEWGIPSCGTTWSAAVDLRACLEDGKDFILVEPNQTVMIGTGVAISLGSANLAGMILPRSGLGSKLGVVLGNTIGLIDADYQGELKLCIWNRSKEPFTIKDGDKIAQYMIVQIARPVFNIVEEFKNSTLRGDNGFGSTGVSA